MEKEENIVSYTTEELDRMPDRTDWERLRAMRDEDIDTSDIPELGEDFFRLAKIVVPGPKTPVNIRLDNEVLAWFKKRGKGYQSHINAVLKAFIHTRPDTN